MYNNYDVYIGNKKKPIKVKCRLNYSPQLENIFIMDRFNPYAGYIYTYYIIVEMCENDIFCEKISKEKYISLCKCGSLYWFFTRIK